MKKAPRLAWVAARGATYYNVQLFRAGHKILSLWPKVNNVQLPQAWRFGGHRYQLSHATYTWYVWPGWPALREPLWTGARREHVRDGMTAPSKQTMRARAFGAVSIVVLASGFLAAAALGDSQPPPGTTVIVTVTTPVTALRQTRRRRRRTLPSMLHRRSRVR